MKKQYKALMLDLDGTTIPNDPKGMPTQRVKEAIAKASKKLHVGVITGRPFFFAKDVISALSLSGPSIVSGGAQIVDINTSTILWEKTITTEETKLIYKILHELNVDLFIQKANTIADNSSIVLEEDMEVLSFSAHTFPDTADKIITQLGELKDIAVYKMDGWVKEKVWLQIGHSEGTKQHGIFEVAKLLNINTYEIIGVGDGGNDFPLLMACGLKVAMGNAGPDLKAIADYIAPSVHDDGVADVIEKFIL